MIILKKLQKKIPSFRHRTDVQLYDNTFKKLKHSVYHKPLSNYFFIKRKKSLFKPFLYTLNTSVIKNNNVITKQFVYNFRPYKKLTICQTLTGLEYIFPGIANVNIGKILFSQTDLFTFNNNNTLRGFITYLKYVPTNTICSNIMNTSNTKITYSKASGVYSKLKKTKKTKKKLLLIELPSKQDILLPKYTKVYIGQNQNFNNNELVEGSWGGSFSIKKKINVRGVAMNPVDHPNGGRTKTVQPERSPWNWVAKKKK